MKKPHDDWFYFAGEDLAFARSGFEDGFYAHVCFLSQQAVEKAMKGYLVVQGKKYPKTHNLIDLLGLMDVNWLDSYLSVLKMLSEVYIPLRYPDAVAGALPERLPGREDADEMLKSAEKIVQEIQSKI